MDEEDSRLDSLLFGLLGGVPEGGVGTEDFLSIVEAIPIGVGVIRVGPEDQFVIIREAITVLIWTIRIQRRAGI